MLKFSLLIASYALSVGAFALKLIEYNLAQTDMVGGDLYIFVFFDVLQSLFKGEDDGGHYFCLVVSPGGTHIGELLRLGDVDYDVIVLGIFTYYLACIYLILREDEEAAAVL